jgi:hypothetical protein
MNPEQLQNQQIQQEIDQIIQDLESQKVSLDSPDGEVGLGDVVESILQKFGITEERFKFWFNLKECGCSKRKKYLNKLKLWKKPTN